MSHLSDAATAMTGIVLGTDADQLSAPTPCAGFDVRRLVHHLLFWGPPLEGAARKEAVAPAAADEADVDLTTGDWRGDLLAQLDRLAAAWEPEDAWTGMTGMGGPKLPAAVFGDMVLGELAVHGWDLARATGQQLVLPPALATYLHGSVAGIAAQGREMGLFGPEVPVPADAPTFDRVLGLTGRDPSWVSADASAPSAAG
jgi:uncharacterized protein (TIGR03086 family)